MANDLISLTFRFDFQEFCSSYFVLRQIRHCFDAAEVKIGMIPAGRIVSGERRTLVEQYYGGLKWSDKNDANKFLKVVEIAFSQSYLSEDSRKELTAILEREGYIIDHTRIRRASQPPVAFQAVEAEQLEALKQHWIDIGKSEPQQRGFAFEKLLVDIFTVFGLSPKLPFRLIGEQIDGSFQLDTDIYLLEAKWQAKQTPQSDLLIFKGKVENKATWTRGLFVSYNGFSQDGLEAFARGRATNMVGMDGSDLYFVLEGQISLQDAIRLKLRHAAETGEFYASLFQLLRT